MNFSFDFRDYYEKNIDLKILFVCMSNTGRSPLAEAVLKSKLQEQQILEGFASLQLACV